MPRECIPLSVIASIAVHGVCLSHAHLNPRDGKFDASAHFSFTPVARHV